MDSLLIKLAHTPWFPVVTSIIGGVTAILFGTWIPLLTAMLLAQGIDIASGLLVGKQKQEVSSRTMYEGLKRKAGMWMLIIAANLLDVYFFAGVPVAKTAAASLCISVEGLSLLENLGKLGVPIPNAIKNFLIQLREDNSGDDFEQKGDD